jgi:diadenosine tetraphosphatase ApaH/serine/threonine PP2A family protein phosphatase
MGLSSCAPRARGTVCQPVILALLSDIHANLEALRACISHAGSRGADRYAFLGDLIGYGADPTAVLDIAAEYLERGAVVVKGNHDEAVDSSSAWLNASAMAAIEWTRGVLEPRHSRFIASLPLCVREGDACFVHASAAMPEEWEYVDSPAAAEKSAAAAGTPYTFSGHVHDQLLYAAGPLQRMVVFRPQPGVPIPLGAHRRWLALVGSVGQPRDGNPAAAYATFDTEAKSLTFHRVPYDCESAARKVRAAGLPEALAYRLERGI